MASVLDNRAKPNKTVAQTGVFHDSTTPKEVVASTHFTVLHTKNHKPPILEGVKHDITGIISRPFEVSTFQFSLTDTYTRIVNDFIPEITIMTNPQVLDKLQYFKYITDAELVFELRFNPQPTQQGIYCVTQMPAYGYRTSIYEQFIDDTSPSSFHSGVQATSLPTEYINLKDNNSVWIKPSFRSFSYGYDLTIDEGTWGRCLTWCLSPLQDVAATGSIQVSLIAHFCNPEFSWPTGKPIFATPPGFDHESVQKAIVEHMRNTLKLKVPNIRTDTNLNKTLQFQGDDSPSEEPTASQTNLVPTTTVQSESVGQILGGAASKLIDKGVDYARDLIGLSKQRIPSSYSIVRNQLTPFVNNYNAYQDPHVMGLDYGNTIGKYNLQNNGTSKFSYIAGREVYLDTVTVNLNDPIGQIYSKKLNPWDAFKQGGPSTEPFYALTPQSAIAWNFTMVQCNFHFIIRIAHTPFHKYRFKCSFDPSVDTAVSGSNVTKTEFFDLDTKVDHYDFTCEYAQNSPFLIRPNVVYNTDPTDPLNTGSTYPSPPSTNGTFYISSYTPLDAPSMVPPSIKLLVFLKIENPIYANNVSLPISNSVNTVYPEFNNTPPPELEFQGPGITIDGDPIPAAVSDPKDHEVIDEDNKLLTTLDEPSPQQNSSVCYQTGGERVASVEALLQQYNIFATFDTDTTIPPNWILILQPAQLYAPFADTVRFPTQFDNIDYWLPMFDTWRSSIDVMVDFPTQMNLASRFTVYKVTEIMDPNTDVSRISGLPVTPFMKQIILTSKHQFDVGGLEGVLNFNSPFMSPYPLGITNLNTDRPASFRVNCGQSFAILPTNDPFGGFTIPAGTKFWRKAGPDLELGAFMHTNFVSLYPVRAPPA